MNIEDASQNLRLRLRLIHAIVILLLILLGARLYYLQIIRGAYYSERAENQRVRLLPLPAPRGAVFDRNSKLLVDSRSTYNVILSREDIKEKSFDSMVEPLASGLGVDPEYLNEVFVQAKAQPAYESIKIKEGATQRDVSWVDAHNLEFPELRVEQQPQRRYPENGMLAHVLGYVGQISTEQLEQPKYKDRKLKPGDIIGKQGIEAVYDEYLRGRDGYRKVIVDSKGRVQEELGRVEPQPGQDLVLTIDSDLQLVAEERLRNSPHGRGAIIALDPNNGEILAMASAPVYDPNLFTQRISTREGHAEYARLLNDPETPLLNRAIQGAYPPGSTWKIPMAIAGLQQGAITLQNNHMLCGGGITIGSKFTRCMHGNDGSPDLRNAIRFSCDGYFYHLGLKMGLDGIKAMVEEFDLNKKTGIDLPQERVSITPSKELKGRLNPRDPEWRDIDTVYASFGQGTDVITPIAMLRTIAGIGVGGKLYVPHLLKEVRELGSVGGDATDHNQEPTRPKHLFDRLEPKIVPISAAQHDLVVSGMWAVVNEGGGTGGNARIAGFDVAGKTGTAQVVSLGKDIGQKKDHSWFNSYAPAYKPEIACVALIENAGFGGTYAAPAVRAIYDVYYEKSRGQPTPGR